MQQAQLPFATAEATVLVPDVPVAVPAALNSIGRSPASPNL